MPDLVAIDLPAGPEWVTLLRSTWDEGHAVAPIDQRWSPVARQRALDMLKPARVIGPQGAQPCPGALPVAEGDALVMCTSGSTGGPKGVVLTHAAVAASAQATSQRLGVEPDRHRWLACLPLNHIGGLAVITRALLTGTDLTVQDGFDPQRVAHAAGPEVLVSLVPTALARTDAALFYRVVLGGSSPPAGLAANVLTTYGMTETGSGVVYDGAPLDGVEVALSPAGEVRLRGPMLFRAYRDGSGARAPDDWFSTGDIGALGTDGRLQVQGRLSDMIITGGENVWPQAVEELVGQHPGVSEVGVASRPDPEWGEVVVVLVVPTDPSAPPGLAELKALVRSGLAPYAAPKELVLVEQLPRTSLGKLKRDQLKSLVRPEAP